MSDYKDCVNHPGQRGQVLLSSSEGKAHWLCYDCYNGQKEKKDG